MIIENFTLKEFLMQDTKLVNEYIVALSYLKPCKTKRTVFHMKLKHVELIKKKLYSGQDNDLIKIVGKVQGISKEEVIELPIIEFFRLMASIREQMEVIARAEESSLTPSEVNFKWAAVDGDKIMAKFGIYNTLESLSGGDALKYKKYMEMAYSEIFTILFMRKTASELAKEMDEIKTKND